MTEIDSQIPFFLVGGTRSGTTLLGLMLDSHPELSWFHHFDWAVKYVGTDGSWPTITQYQAALKHDSGFQSWQLLVDQNASSYPDVLNGFLQQRRERDGKAFSGATIHARYTELLKIWPNAYFIHIVRDPRDVVSSTLKKGWSGNAWGAAKRWKAAETEWDSMCDSVPEERRLFIKFEDLLSDPINTLQKITSFLGISYTDEMFSYTSRTPYSYPNSKLAGKWQANMPLKSIEMVELAVGSLLDKRGYQRVTEKKEASYLEQVSLTFMNRLEKFKLRVSRYGWRLWAIQFIARQLGSPSQLQWAIRRVEAIDEKILKSSKDYIADPNLRPQ